MDIDELFKMYAIEWSEKQQQFHVQPVEKMLQSNLDSFYHRSPRHVGSDWIVLGFANSSEEASAYIQELKSRMDRPYGQ